ncbi:MAG: VWA domain-containing protein [Candidatus Limnocylindrales bacterium]
MAIPRQRDDGADDPWAVYGGDEVRYARWDGSQRLPDLSAEDILGAMSDDLMEEGDVAEALMRLLRRGLPGRADGMGDPIGGLESLRKRLAQARRAALQRYHLDDVLGDIRAELDSIVASERRGIERRLTASPGDTPELGRLAADLAARRQERLEALPEDLGERIRALSDYDFLEPEARDRFDRLLERLRGQVLEAAFQGMSQAIADATPEQLAANREMVRDLDQLLNRRLAGDEPSQDDVDAFLARHGSFFPGARTLDDIMESLADRMAAMQSLLRSMTPEQRAELDSMMDALLRDDRLRWDLAQLASTLDQLMPGGLGERLRFRGDEPLGLEGALAQLERIGRMERLGEQLGGMDAPGAIEDVDDIELRDLLGDEAADELAALREMARRLEEAGYVSRDGHRMELTPRGARRLGQQVLDQLFARLSKDAFGDHDIHRSGATGERSDTSSPWEFGRPFDLDLRATLRDAMLRPENAVPVAQARVAAGGRRIVLAPEDFAVADAEDRSAAATVLLLDMSRSMLLRDCAVAAKRVALALQALIRSRYPRDTLHIVSFAYAAREIPPESLATVSWDAYEYGTNLQHGLQVARRLLARSRSTDRSILVITDGEPTAHVEDGRVEFSYPPTRRTIAETLREVMRCTREGIVINTFMLDRSPSLAAFVEHITRLNRGRAFHADPEDLGRYVLVDYVGRRTRRG